MVSAIKGVDCITGVWKVAACTKIWYKHLPIGCKGKKVKVKAPCFMSVAFNSHHLTNLRPTAHSLYPLYWSMSAIIYKWLIEDVPKSWLISLAEKELVPTSDCSWKQRLRVVSRRRSSTIKKPVSFTLATSLSLTGYLINFTIPGALYLT